MLSLFLFPGQIAGSNVITLPQLHLSGPDVVVGFPNVRNDPNTRLIGLTMGLGIFKHDSRYTVPYPGRAPIGPSPRHFNIIVYILYEAIPALP